MHLTLSRYAAPVGELLLVTDGDTLRALDFADYEARMRTLLARHYGAVTLTDGPLPGDRRRGARRLFRRRPDRARRAAGGDRGQRLPAVASGRRCGDPGGDDDRLRRARGRARQARRGARGRAGERRNPIGIVVPCHRVIGADGTLTGYAGGVARKEWLLRHEGAITG